MARILLIDDSAAAVEIVRQWLVASGHDVLALGVAESISRLAKRETVDLVVTDVCMAEAERAELLRVVRHLRPELPCLVLRPEMGSVQCLPAARVHPATHHHAKPFNRWQLDAAVHRTLSGTASHPEPAGLSREHAVS
ncbi:hypothetical protein DB347_11880 [Opitutaceae bacterium EW11]|nr:hypothetical protein DB347_11880 [Opitutaceae bacterium EW11]